MIFEYSQSTLKQRWSLRVYISTIRLLFRLLLVCTIFSVVTATGYASSYHPGCQSFSTLSSNVYKFSADLDGVDGSDLFVADRTGNSTIITACDYVSMGPWDMGDTNKPLNTVVVVDVEGDGKDELIIGGTSGSSPLAGAVSRLIGTRLERKETVSVRPASNTLVGETFQCIDTNEDGLREIVNYTYNLSTDGSEIHWRGSDKSNGIFMIPSQSAEAWMFQSGQCGENIIVNLDFLVNGYPQQIALEAVNSHLQKGRPVQFGINNNLLLRKTPEQLTEANDWVIPIEHYAGYEGPFSILEFLEKAQTLTVGPHNHCVGQPLKPPKLSQNNLLQLSAQPRQTNSCLQWFSVDFWVRQNFTIEAIILNIWEP